jgi:Tol biopolymer transport system component
MGLIQAATVRPGVRRAVRALALAAAALAGALVAPLSASAATVNVTAGVPGEDFALSWSPDGSALAFLNAAPTGAVDGHGNPVTRNEIMSRRLDGTALRSLVGDAGNLRITDPPVWAPNGSKIAYGTQTTDTFDSDVWIMNPDGSGQTNLTFSSTNTNAQFNMDRLPSWSPDSQRIAFDSTRSGAQFGADDIWVMNADGSGPVDLTAPSGNHEDFATWSPDGSKIAFSATGDNVYAVNADGTGFTLLSRGQCPCAWSPDSSRVLFNTALLGSDNNNDIFSVNADGTDRQNLSNSPANDFMQGTNASWVGGKITFSSDRDDSAYDIYTMNGDGTGVTRLTTGGSADEGSLFSPDGQSVAFISNRCGAKFGIFVVPTSGETDSTGPCPTGSSDSDGDGIPDAIDSSPSTPSSDFNDGAGTSGTLVSTGGLTVTLTDAPAPDGVHLTVGAGTGQVSLRMCPGNYTMRLSPGSDAVLTCGSITARMLHGSAEVVLGGGLTVVTIPSGVTAKVSTNPDGTFAVQNQGGGTVTVKVDGATSTVAPGATKQVVAVTPSGLCHLTQQYLQSSAKYKALTARQRATVDAQINAICQGIAVISPKLSPAKKAAAIAAYKVAVAGLVKAGWLTQAQASTLVGLTSSL